MGERPGARKRACVQTHVQRKQYDESDTQRQLGRLHAQRIDGDIEKMQVQNLQRDRRRGRGRRKEKKKRIHKTHTPKGRERETDKTKPNRLVRYAAAAARRKTSEIQCGREKGCQLSLHARADAKRLVELPSRPEVRTLGLTTGAVAWIRRSAVDTSIPQALSPPLLCLPIPIVSFELLRARRVDATPRGRARRRSLVTGKAVGRSKSTTGGRVEADRRRT